MIFGAIAILLGIGALYFSSAIIKLAKNGEIPESDVLYTHFSSGASIPVMKTIGLLIIVAGVLLIALPALEYFVALGHAAH